MARDLGRNSLILTICHPPQATPSDEARPPRICSKIWVFCWKRVEYTHPFCTELLPSPHHMRLGLLKGGEGGTELFMWLKQSCCQL